MSSPIFEQSIDKKINFLSMESVLVGVQILSLDKDESEKGEEQKAKSPVAAKVALDSQEKEEELAGETSDASHEGRRRQRKLAADFLDDYDDDDDDDDDDNADDADNAHADAKEEDADADADWADEDAEVVQASHKKPSSNTIHGNEQDEEEEKVAKDDASKKSPPKSPVKKKETPKKAAPSTTAEVEESSTISSSKVGHHRKRNSFGRSSGNRRRTGDARNNSDYAAMDSGDKWSHDKYQEQVASASASASAAAGADNSTSGSRGKRTGRNSRKRGAGDSRKRDDELDAERERGSSRDRADHGGSDIQESGGGWGKLALKPDSSSAAATAAGAGDEAFPPVVKDHDWGKTASTQSLPKVNDKRVGKVGGERSDNRTEQRSDNRAENRANNRADNRAEQRGAERSARNHSNSRNNRKDLSSSTSSSRRTNGGGRGGGVEKDENFASLSSSRSGSGRIGPHYSRNVSHKSVQVNLIGGDLASILANNSSSGKRISTAGSNSNSKLVLSESPSREIHAEFHRSLESLQKGGESSGSGSKPAPDAAAVWSEGGNRSNHRVSKVSLVEAAGKGGEANDETGNGEIANGNVTSPPTMNDEDHGYQQQQQQQMNFYQRK